MAQSAPRPGPSNDNSAPSLPLGLAEFAVSPEAKLARDDSPWVAAAHEAFRYWPPGRRERQGEVEFGQSPPWRSRPRSLLGLFCLLLWLIAALITSGKRSSAGRKPRDKPGNARAAAQGAPAPLPPPGGPARKVAVGRAEGRLAAAGRPCPEGISCGSSPCSPPVGPAGAGAWLPRSSWRRTRPL
jgi:hypothetical protein